MNFKGKKVALSGHDGFIGGHLVRALQDAGAEVTIILGDIRDRTTFRNLNYKHDYYFHFSAPSSQVLFKRQPMYAAEVTLKGFINAAKICKENGIKLIYPSTGLLSQDRMNEYALCKKLCEQIHLDEGLDAIGIRIFATYGPGEDHKRDYASVPFLFARDMVNGLSPEIYGDGKQKRDFIFVDDTVHGVMFLSETRENGIYDLGSGVGTTFNELVAIINKELGTDIEPVYIDKPGGYVDETLATGVDYVAGISIEDGLIETINHLRSIRDGKSDSNNND